MGWPEQYTCNHACTSSSESFEVKPLSKIAILWYARLIMLLICALKFRQLSTKIPESGHESNDGITPSLILYIQWEFSGPRYKTKHFSTVMSIDEVQEEKSSTD